MSDLDAVRSPIGRQSWSFVFGEGDTGEEGKSKYKTTHMFPKNIEAMDGVAIDDDKKQKIVDESEKFISDLRARSKRIAESRFGEKWKSSRWDPIIDGDEKVDAGAYNANFWLVRMKTQFKPKIMRARLDEGLINDGDDDTKTGFYSGCWAKNTMSLYTYQVQGKKGVAVGMGSIQKAYNDEPLGAGNKDPGFDEDIEDLDIDESDFAKSEIDDLT